MERQGAPADTLQEEARLRKIEKQLPLEETGGVTFTPSPNDVDVTNSVPQVVGLSVGPGIRNLTFKWNDANVPQVEFDYYEIQISTSAAFPSLGLVIDRTQDLQYTFYEGDPNTEYFARVRASLNDGRTGDFSSTVNLTTGLAVAGDFVPESIIVPSVAFSAATQNVLIAGTEVVVQTLVVDTIGAPILVLIAFDHASTIGGQALQDIYIKRNSVTLIQFTVFLHSSGAGTFEAIAFAYFDETPGVGSTTYTLEYDNTLAGVGNDAQVSNRTLVAIELKK